MTVIGTGEKGRDDLLAELQMQSKGAMKPARRIEDDDAGLDGAAPLSSEEEPKAATPFSIVYRLYVTYLVFAAAPGSGERTTCLFRTLRPGWQVLRNARASVCNRVFL